jgi:hypothetical protein
MSAEVTLRRAPSLLLKYKSHQPGRHRPGVSIDVSLHHDSALIVKAGFDHSYGRVAFFVRTANQIKVRIRLGLAAPGSKGQSNLSCAHLNLSGDDFVAIYLDYDAVKEVV